MKKLLACLCFFSSPCFAGTINIYSSSENHGISFLQAAHGPSDFVASTTTFLIPGVTLTSEVFQTEVKAQVPFYSSGTISGLWVSLSSNGISAGSTVTLRINGVSVNESVVIPANTVGEYLDSTHTDIINYGDKVAFMLQTGASGTQMEITGIEFVFTPTQSSEGVMKMVGSGVGDVGTNNGFSQFYTNFSGEIGNGNGDLTTQTERLTYYQMVSSGTFSHFSIYLSTDARVGNTTFKFRKNGVDGNQIITIAGQSPPGIYIDNTHTDSVVIGDSITYNIHGDNDNGSNFVRFSWIATEFRGTNASVVEYPAQTSGHSFTPGLSPIIMPVLGALGFDSGEINDYEQLTQVAGTFSNMHIYVTSNDADQAVVIHFRKNQSDGNQVITIPAGTSGYFEDTTHTDVVTAIDKVDYRWTSSMTSGSAPFNYLGARFTHQ